MQSDNKIRLNVVKEKAAENATLFEEAVTACKLDNDLQSFVPLIKLMCNYNAAAFKLLPTWKEFFT